MIHTNRVIAQLPIHLITTRDADGCDCYFILRTTNASFTQLKAQQRKAPVDISEYGEILSSGYGSAPLPAEKRALTQRYGINFDA